MSTWHGNTLLAYPVFPFIALSLLSGFSEALIGTNYVVFLVQRGLTLGEIGFVLGAYSAAVATLGFPAGGLADVHGRKKILLVGFSLFSTGLFAYGFSWTYTQFVIVEVVAGIGAALMSGAGESWFVDEAKPKFSDAQIAKVFGVRSGAYRAVAIAAGIVAIPLLSHSSNSTFLVAGVTGFSGVALGFLIMKENCATTGGRVSERLLHAIKHFQNNLQLIIATVVSLGVRSLFMLLILAWQPFLYNLGTPQAWMGGIFSGLMLANSLGSFAFAKLFERLNLRGTVLISTVGIAVSFGGLIFSVNPYSALALFLLLELSLGLYSPASQVWRNSVIPSEFRTSLVSAANTLGSFSTAASLCAFGYVAQNFGFSVLFALGVAVALVSIALALKFGVASGRL